jgi:DNA-binding Lrp family transcriptional regulator
LARRVNLSTSGLKKRRLKLEREGIIEKKVILVDRNALGLGLQCFVHVSLAHQREDADRQFRDVIERMPEVMECHFLKLLQEDGTRSDAELARRVNLSTSGLKKRRLKLEREGIIEKKVILVDRNALGLGLQCFVHVSLAHQREDADRQFRDVIERMPEVMECHFLTGQHDYLLKVVVRNYADLERLLSDLTRPPVERLLTSIVLTEVKRTTSMPLDLAQGETAADTNV